MIIEGGIVYDPRNGILGEEMEISIEDGRVVEESRDGDKIDARGMLVMPGGLDAHAHIAGAKVNTGRIMRPEDGRRGTEARTKLLRPQTGYTVPNCYAMLATLARLHHRLRGGDPDPGGEKPTRSWRRSPSSTKGRSPSLGTTGRC